MSRSELSGIQIPITGRIVASALFACCALLPVSASQQAKKPVVSAGNADTVRFFDTEVRPLLKQNCLTCHGGDRPAGGLSLTGGDALRKGGLSGPAVSPASPERSLLLRAVRYLGPKMPPTGRLPQAQIDVLARWVRLGAPWPAGDAQPEPAGPPKVTPEAMRFWAFQPVRRPTIPRVKNGAWVRTPVDNFILAKLEATGQQPVPPAAKTALLRRLYYDLIGLPPSPAEVHAFLKDSSPDAYNRVVERLLASPQYGERWGRHWLDLVRYAETNSYERDGPKPNAWRYRDYVIKSFAADKPYDQFVREQLAGDELPERTADSLIATGFYRLGIWDDEPSDPQQALYDDLDDIVSTTGQVFLGLTVNCARCHDHKLDPIPQRDYYRLLSFFNGINRLGVRSNESVAEASLRPIAPPEEIQRQKSEVAAHEERVRRNSESLQALERKVAADLMPVEKEEFRNETLRPQILKKRVPSLVSPSEYARYLALTEERDRLRRSAPKALDMALCVTEQGPRPRETHVLLRGNPHVEGEKVEPGFPSVLNPPSPIVEPPASAHSCGRRLALARWIASPENPLTARVMVNRIWQYHFGRGIVRTTSNFGFQGTRATHPELLDWLAAEFVAQGWRMKPIHRLIVTSAAYRMSSQSNPRALTKDPENDLFWRFDMRRLEAEEVRDSILAANGSLNLDQGGPSVYPVIPPAVLAGQSVPGAGWGKSTEQEQCRRSVYIYVKRSLTLPMIASFDGPETDFSCPVRFATVQPTQALGMLNSEFMQQQARVFAAFLKQHAGESPADQIRMALERVLQRSPTEKEVARGVRLLAALQRDPAVSAEGALVAYCVVALNLNEFLYLD